jgi:hypothetical protein
MVQRVGEISGLKLIRKAVVLVVLHACSTLQREIVMEVRGLTQISGCTSQCARAGRVTEDWKSFREVLCRPRVKLDLDEDDDK